MGCRLYGPDKAKTNFPVEDYGSVLAAGGASTTSPGSDARGAPAGAVPETMLPSIDGQVLSAELQALVGPIPHKDHDMTDECLVYEGPPCLVMGFPPLFIFRGGCLEPLMVLH